jgi:hypothetical protein
VGCESSGGGQLLIGSTPYAAVLSQLSNYPLQFGTNNAVRMTITAAGNVGIGTTTPDQLLTIDGTAPIVEIRSGGYLQLRNAANSYDMRLQQVNSQLNVVSGGSLSTSIASFLSGGYVGIGTAGPSHQLTVSGSNTNTFPLDPQAVASQAGALRVTDTNFGVNSGGLIVFGASTSSFAAIKGLLQNGGGYSSGDIGFYIRPNTATQTLAEGMRLTAAGNFICQGTGYFVGTLSFNTQLLGNNGLEVINTADASYLRINQSNQFPNGVWFGNSLLKMGSNHFLLGTAGGNVGEIDISATAQDTVNRITLNGNSGAVNFFNTGGSFGIGITAPLGGLHVATSPNQWSSTNFGACIVADGTRNNAIAILDNTHANPIALVNWASDFHIFAAPALTDASSAATPLVTVKRNGNVGLSYTGPVFLLQLALDSAAKPGTSTWSAPSDVRLKKNIRPFEYGLAVLRQIEPIRYQYNGKNKTPEDYEGVGVDAKAMQAILPETVLTHPGEIDGEETDLFAFNPHALFFVLINACKELAARIETLEQRRN